MFATSAHALGSSVLILSILFIPLISTFPRLFFLESLVQHSIPVVFVAHSSRLHTCACVPNNFVIWVYSNGPAVQNVEVVGLQLKTTVYSHIRSANQECFCQLIWCARVNRARRMQHASRCAYRTHATAAKGTWQNCASRVRTLHAQFVNVTSINTFI